MSGEAKPVCVIGAHIRNRLFGDPESTDQEINPVGKIIHINRQPFTVIGMFIEYMTDAEQKRRELERQKRTKIAPDPGEIPDTVFGETGFITKTM